MDATQCAWYCTVQANLQLVHVNSKIEVRITLMVDLPEECGGDEDSPDVRQRQAELRPLFPVMAF